MEVPICSAGCGLIDHMLRAMGTLQGFKKETERLNWGIPAQADPTSLTQTPEVLPGTPAISTVLFDLASNLPKSEARGYVSALAWLYARQEVAQSS